MSEIDVKIEPVATYEDFSRRLKKFSKSKGLTFDNIFEIKDLYVDCLSQEEIIKIIKSSFDIGDKLAMEFDALGYYVFKNNFSLRADDVIAEHIKRYDVEIKRLRDFVPNTSNPAFARKIANEAKLCLLDTLHQKEKLLGFHTKNFSLKVYNTININNKKIKKDDFDLSKLTLNEKIEFVNLINKATRTEDELDPGYVNQKIKSNETTIDIEHEEIVTEKVEEKSLNIEKIELEEVEEKIDIDYVPAQITISDKLREALRKKAEEQFSKLKDNQMPSEKEQPIVAKKTKKK